jgi:hypothetical protein
MMNLLRKTFRSAAQQRTAPKARRVLRGRLECLESRCMLSLAPAPDEYSAAAELSPASELVDVIIIGSAGHLFPGTAELKFPDLPEVPFEPGGYPPSVLPGGPVWGHEPPSQDQGDAGGMIDVGGFDKDGPDTFGGGWSLRETRAVLDLLASLSYRPNQPDLEDLSLPGELPALAEFQLPRPKGALAAGQVIEGVPAEGGMVAIAAEELVAPRPSNQVSSNDRAPSLLEVSVQMDSASGRFQAFEVGAAEEPALPTRPPETEAADARSARRPASEEAEPASRVPRFPNEARGQVDESKRSQVKQQTDSVPPAAAESLPPAVQSPADSSHESSNPSWTMTVALLSAAAGVLALRVGHSQGSIRPAGVIRRLIHSAIALASRIRSWKLVSRFISARIAN